MPTFTLYMIYTINSSFIVYNDKMYQRLTLIVATDEICDKSLIVICRILRHLLCKVSLHLLLVQ